jgi:hypothetical protein
MSRFAVYSTTKLVNREILLAALATIGYAVGEQDIHDQAVEIRDYHGNKAQVHIVLRREATPPNVRGVYSDAGFRREAHGTYTPIVDHLATATVNGQTVPFGQAVETAYGKIVGDRALSTLLRTTVPMWKQSGRIPMHATAVRQGDVVKVRW